MVECFDAFLQPLQGLEIGQDRGDARQNAQPWDPERDKRKPQDGKGQASGHLASHVFLRGDSDAQAGEIRLIALPPVFAHGEQLFKQRGHRPQQACRLFLKRWLPVRVTDGVARARRRQVQEPSATR